MIKRSFYVLLLASPLYGSETGTTVTTTTTTTSTTMTSTMAATATTPARMSATLIYNSLVQEGMPADTALNAAIEWQEGEEFPHFFGPMRPPREEQKDNTR